MKFRKRPIFTGEVFEVPQHIVRQDDKATHGWQLRYGKFKLFSDHSNDGSGAAASLREATKELSKRIKRLPAPTRLRTDVMKNKKSGLPLGISGPIPRLRPGKNTAYYSFQVTVPIPGGRTANRSVYIGTENTMTPERFEMALAKAIALRDSQVRKAKLAHTRTKRELAVAAGLDIEP